MNITNFYTVFFFSKVFAVDSRSLTNQKLSEISTNVSFNTPPVSAFQSFRSFFFLFKSDYFQHSK